MNAYKYFLYLINSNWLIKMIKILISLVTVILMTLSSTQAAPCFDNPQTAYDYLIAQENVEIQAITQAGVNINRADEGELTTLKGIGSSKAQEIILYREMFGEFKTIDDLAKVKGIGKKTVENNRSRLKVKN